MLQVRNSVDDDFDGNRNLLLHLFGRAAGPLGNDLDIVISHIRIRFHGQIVERNRAPDQQQDGEGRDQKPVVECEID